MLINYMRDSTISFCRCKQSFKEIRIIIYLGPTDGINLVFPIKRNHIACACIVDARVKMPNPLFTEKIQRLESRKICIIHQGCFCEQDSVGRIAVNIPTA